MYSISKDFEFSASHQLTGLPEGHQCSRLHGHNYKVRLILSAKNLVIPGFVIDYGELKWFKEHLDAHYDHKHLNDVVVFNPTAEYMARHFFDVVSKWLLENGCIGVKCMVSVSETEKTWASYAEVEDE
jgi:6-pyruvoyltetrahydropterin/6-carboxytetrahydropterin synthase